MGCTYSVRIPVTNNIEKDFNVHFLLPILKFIFVARIKIIPQSTIIVYR